MEAIRQTVKVKNNTINITLPDNFSAEEVDVIIFPSQNDKYIISEIQINEVGEKSSEYHTNSSSVSKLKEHKSDFFVSDDQIKVLNERSKEDNSKFITAEESLARLKKRHRV